MIPCHLCGASELRVIEEFAVFRRVTSDCRPWPSGGKLAVCGDCDTAQAVPDEQWEEEAGRIYGGYEIYRQAGGVEQAVFESEKGTPCTRSRRLAARLLECAELPGSGRLLDIGCGNGAWLRAFGERRPRWRMTGSEVGDRNRDVVESIPGVERLHTGPLRELAPGFQVISMIHVLEHIAHPVRFLEQVGALLAPEGRLVIEVPDLRQNPFDLLIADHASHFTKETLVSLVHRARFNAEIAADDWVAKELSIVARGAVSAGGSRPSKDGVLETVHRALAWLDAVRRSARARAASGPLGVFGTSIAGTWLFAELDGLVEFFVDEDPARGGSTWMGRPVLYPSDLAPDAEVFMALPFPLAVSVKERLASGRGNFHLPPPPFGR